MKFIHNQKYLNRGKIVRVRLDKPANVLLLDNINYQNFRSGRDFNHYGGLAKVSPCDILVPNSGYWHIVIYPVGYSGIIRYSIKII